MTAVHRHTGGHGHDDMALLLLGICWAVDGDGGPSPVRPERVVRPYRDVGVGTMLL